MNEHDRYRDGDPDGADGLDPTQDTWSAWLPQLDGPASGPASAPPPNPTSPLREFGGYGWRIGKDGSRGFVTRSGEALVVERVGEPPVVVTVDDAAEAAAVLNTLASRRS